MDKIYYQNVRGLRTKTHLFLKNIHLSNYDIVILTETWLNSSISDREIFDSRYNVYRKDREQTGSYKKDGGGVLIAVSKTVKSARVTNWEDDCENLWITAQLNLNNKLQKIAFCVVYIPPPVSLEVLEKFLERCNDVLSQVDNVVIAGDFNLGFLDWSVAEDVNVNSLHYNLTDRYRKNKQ